MSMDVPTSAADRRRAAEAAAEAVATAEVARASLNHGDPSEFRAAARDADIALARAEQIGGAMPIHAEMERILSSNSPRSADQENISLVVSFLGNEIPIDVPSDVNVQRLKRRLQDVTGVPSEKQVLLGWTDGEPSHDGCVLNTLVRLPTIEPVRLMLWVEDDVGASSSNPTAVPVYAGGTASMYAPDLTDEATSGPDVDMMQCTPSEDVLVASRSSSVSCASVEGVSDDSDDDRLDGSASPDFDDMYFDDDAMTPTTASRPEPMVPPRCSEPYEIANHFADNFSKRYAKEGGVVPAFYRAPLSDALRDAESSAKPLLVYMHSDASPETNIFCSESLSASVVAECVTALTPLYWNCTIVPLGHF
jgi:hypothetical protein